MSSCHTLIITITLTLLSGLVSCLYRCSTHLNILMAHILSDDIRLMWDSWIKHTGNRRCAIVLGTCKTDVAIDDGFSVSFTISFSSVCELIWCFHIYYAIACYRWWLALYETKAMVAATLLIQSVSTAKRSVAWEWFCLLRYSLNIFGIELDFIEKHQESDHSACSKYLTLFLVLTLLKRMQFLLFHIK